MTVIAKRDAAAEVYANRIIDDPTDSERGKYLKGWVIKDYRAGYDQGAADERGQLRAELNYRPTAAEVKEYRKKHDVGMLAAKQALEQSKLTERARELVEAVDELLKHESAKNEKKIVRSGPEIFYPIGGDIQQAKVWKDSIEKPLLARVKDLENVRDINAKAAMELAQERDGFEKALRNIVGNPGQDFVLRKIAREALEKNGRH